MGSREKYAQKIHHITEMGEFGWAGGKTKNFLNSMERCKDGTNDNLSHAETNGIVWPRVNKGGGRLVGGL